MDKMPWKLFCLSLSIISGAVVAGSAKSDSTEDILALIKQKKSELASLRLHNPTAYFDELQQALKGVRVKRREKGDTVIPVSFDSRQKWPYCHSIKAVPDQAACLSDWAISTASVMSDRICIHSNGSFTILASAKYILTCCGLCGQGCEGGLASLAWLFWGLRGVASGGLYNTNEGCQNYPFPPCEHDVKQSGVKPTCPDKRYETPECLQRCDSSAYIFQASFTYADEFYQLEQDVEQIQLEIMKNGPVVSRMDLRSDFFGYKGGIYSPSADSIRVGFHSIRLIGWGEENNIPYWLAINSFNEDWGINGILKIVRGQNVAFIEENVSAAIPDIF